jgi:hypothetical protein
MFDNERAYADRIESLLRDAGYSTKREVRVRGGYRIDIVARKDETRVGIEVKFERAGLFDDLPKCEVIHRLPDVDEMYVCAPKVFLSEDAHALAKTLGGGLLAADVEKLEWILPSTRRAPAQLSLGIRGGTLQVDAGADIICDAVVSNGGWKTAVDVDVFLVKAKPFVTPRPSEARARRPMLESGGRWEVTLKARIAKGTKPGRYQLMVSAKAPNVTERRDAMLWFEVRGP